MRKQTSGSTATIVRRHNMGRKNINSDVYELIENGGDVYEDIKGLTFSELEEYFGDLDPAEFL
jgi:hypothetical protein